MGDLIWWILLVSVYSQLKWGICLVITLRFGDVRRTHGPIHTKVRR